MLVGKKAKIHTKHPAASKVNGNMLPKINRKVLGFRFHLAVHNLGDNGNVGEGVERKKEKLKQRNDKKLEAYEQKKIRKEEKWRLNEEKRKAKGKYPKNKSLAPFKPKPYTPTFREWMTDVVGEAPVLLDTSKLSSYERSMHSLLFNQGFFNNKVDIEIKYKGKRKAKLVYHINSEEAYRIDTLSYYSSDLIVQNYLNYSKSKSKLKEGAIYSSYKLAEERERIYEYLQNRAYYFLKEDNITFDVDTSHNDHTISIVLKVDAQPLAFEKIQIKEVNFFVNVGKNVSKDALVHKVLKEVNFYHKDSLVIKPKTILHASFLNPGMNYSLQRQKSTYNRLSSLGIFKYVDIKFEVVQDSTPYLIANIYLYRNQRYAFGLESNGTAKGTNLGVNGTFVFTNKNIFKGAERLNLKLYGGLEAQQALTDNENEDKNKLRLTPNTIQFGPELSLIFPRFLLPIRQDRFVRPYAPKTSFSLNYNHQRRPDFERNTLKFSWAYEWNQNVYLRHIVRPFELSYIKITKSAAFQDLLDNLNDPLLRFSYQDHFIPNLSYGMIFKKDLRNKRYTIFNYLNLESSGSVFRALGGALNLKQDTLGGYQISNITFAHFLKLSNDFVAYFKMNDKNLVAGRLKIGAAQPLRNLKAIPFDEAFFIGGASDLRAWRARSLGPGAHFDTLQLLDKIGDIKLLISLEYRFNIIGKIEGALFADAGNIYLIAENEKKPLGAFKWNDFISKMGLGGGIGLRLNFNFFLIRLDLAMPLYDPALPVGERWLWDPKDNINGILEDYRNANPNVNNVFNFNRVNLNLGIGYPF